MDDMKVDEIGSIVAMVKKLSEEQLREMKEYLQNIIDVEWSSK